MSRPAKALVTGMGVTLMVHGAMALWLWRVYPRLPDPVVTHWGIDGPDGFTDRVDIWWGLLLSLVFTAIIGALLVAVAPKHSTMLGAGAGITAGLGTFLATIIGGSAALQAGRSPDDPMDLNPWWILPVVAASVVVSVVAAALVGPPPSRPAATTIPAPSERLADDDVTREWHAEIATHPAWLFLLLLPLPASIVILLTTGSWVLPILISVIIALPLLGLWRWRLAVDEEAFYARGWLGWPKISVPLRDVERAECRAHVGALEYGGMGLRSTRGGDRLVVRSGPAVRLVLSDGTDFIATTDDADHVARLVNTLLAEQQDRSL